MTPSFRPADGKKSRRQYCIDAVLAAKPGDVIPIEQVMETCECDRPTALNSMWLAKKDLEKGGHNSVEVVRLPGGGPAPGWRVLDRGDRNLNVTDKRYTKSVKAFDRTVRLHNNTVRDNIGDQVNRMRYDRQQMTLVRASAIYQRKTSSLAELQRKAEQDRRKQLPADSEQWEPGA